MCVLGAESFMTKDRRCTACGYIGRVTRDTVRHIESKHLNLRLECHFCHAVLNSTNNLLIHLRHWHLEKSKYPAKDRAKLKDLLTLHLELNQ